MRFSCSQQELSKALSIVSKGVSSRTTIPILKGILLDAKDGLLCLSASDLEISVRTSLKASVHEEGSAVVYAKIFGDIVRKLPLGEVLFADEGEGGAVIRCRQSEFRIVSMPPDEFPVVGEGGDGESIEMDADMLRDMIGKTCFAASIDETRGIITGVLMELKKKSFSMVALDGFRMAVVKESCENENEKEIVISARIMNEVGKIIGETAERGTEGEKKERNRFFIVLDEKRAFFDMKETVVSVRLLDGTFIKYGDIIPKSFAIEAILNRDDFKEGMERASIIIHEGRNNLVKMSFTEGNLRISSRTEEGSLKEDIPAEKKGDDLDIVFNARYIMDILKAIPDEEIRVKMNGSASACLISPLEGEAYAYLVLPVRLSSGS
jgi:DNA polymerase-3 subunit beta